MATPPESSPFPNDAPFPLVGEEPASLLLTAESWAHVLSQERQRLPYSRRIFVNRPLRLDRIDWIGFDMDYTLLRYNALPMDRLSYNEGRKQLVALGYDEALLEFEYNPQRAMRGLLIDKEQGNLLQINHHRHVTAAYHGHRALNKEERKQTYRRAPMKFSSGQDTQLENPDPNYRRFRLIDSLFGVPEACLYADLVEWMESQRKSDEELDFLKLYDDVRTAMDQAHATQSIHRAIEADPATYIIQDPEIAVTLERLRASGKRLFLLTNSDWSYTARAMQFLLEQQTDIHPHWHDFFDLVMVRAGKPRFFRSEEPFEKLSVEGESIGSSHDLQGHKFWRGGNQEDLNRYLGEARDHVLYVGDHIYGDILRTKKSSAWRTMLIVEELERELLLRQEHRESWLLWERMESRRIELSHSLNDLSVLLERLHQFETQPNSNITLQEQAHASALERTERQQQRVQSELENVVERSEALLTEIEQNFNPYWGMLFREGHQYSYLGEQVRAFACIYTSRITNLLGYTPHQYFRPPLPLLPHEMPEEWDD